jgi:hypothetical protein
MNVKTPDEKISEALGIESGNTVEDVLSSFDEELENIESSMKSAVDKIDTSIDATGDMHDLRGALGELSELIGTSKSMLGDVYDYISRSEIMDPDVIRSGADLIKASTELIREYLDIYKEKIRHFNSIEMEMIKHENKKNLEKYKHELKNGGDVTDDNNIDTYEYTQETIVKAIANLER